MSGNYEERDVTFDIIEDIGVISVQETGWAKEINLVRWNGGVAKYDIRDWDPLHERMSRGITLHEDEMRRLLELMKHRRSRSRSRSAAAERRPAQPDTTSDNAGSDSAGAEDICITDATATGNQSDLPDCAGAEDICITDATDAGNQSDLPDCASF